MFKFICKFSFVNFTNINLSPNNKLILFTLDKSQWIIKTTCKPPVANNHKDPPFQTTSSCKTLLKSVTTCESAARAQVASLMKTTAIQETTHLFLPLLSHPDQVNQSPTIKNGSMKVSRKAMICLPRERKESKAIKLLLRVKRLQDVLSDTSTAVKSASMPIRTKKKKPVFVLCHGIREERIWDVMAARLVAAKGARRRISCSEAKTRSIILMIRRSKARRKRKGLRPETVVAKAAWRHFLNLGSRASVKYLGTFVRQN